MQIPSVSRRTFLLGGVTTAVMIPLALGIGPLKVMDWVRHTIVRRLGPLPISDSDMERFCKDFVQHDLSTLMSPQRARLFAALEGLGAIQAIKILGVQPVIVKKEQCERRMVTAFLLRTNFFRLYDKTPERIIYTGLEGPCLNPFARFAFDS